MSTSAITLDAVPVYRRLYWALVDALVVTRRHLLHIPQQHEQWISATVQPIIFVLLFRYVFGGAIQTPEASYINFLMAGIFVQSVVMEGMTGGIGLAHDLKRGIIDRFRTLPMAPSAVLTGPIVADTLRNLFVIGVMLVLGLAVGFRPQASALAWCGAIGLLVATSFAVSWVGSVVALLVRDPEAVQVMSFVVMMPLAFASSAFVPVETMPGWLQPIVRHQPVTVIVDTVRGLLLGQSTGAAPWQALAWCAAIVAVCAPLSVVLYRRLSRA
ncbi:ABC transporter permease [Sphaerobacter thermophilus]|uniref:Transport permease protein n=1 Tax=Sphaerobacter thermophilus (strain ATCC 49802 / DSM 20745 / KCCM 41009 / NCIMB 13125 / S 6022) TaxID=479434 RepID=D1C4E6_SPHTD|nr:ABC transporter permease [Sphaerobacter thermophilus]ACZ39113.1 ABC-2 type transporter [Sphaerobacter thermophilus DSM 20745]